MSRGFADAWGPGDARVERLQQFIDDITINDGLQDGYSYVPPTTPGTWTRSGKGFGRTVWTDPTWNTWTATPSSWERPRPCKRALKYRPPTSSRIWPMCNMSTEAAQTIRQATSAPATQSPSPIGQTVGSVMGLRMMGSRPSTPAVGDTYYSTSDGEMHTWTGTHWAQLSAARSAVQSRAQQNISFPAAGAAIANLSETQSQPKPWWKRGWKK